mmetsp:Transcript_5240/g.15236  ORF Transcript_5240/g.15236 Transcript_5240/m.15236 type:complete len:209 (+) Transcript_5240:147-773(+)
MTVFCRGRRRPTVVCGLLLLLSVLQSYVEVVDGLVVPLSAAKPAESLLGISLPKVFLGDDSDIENENTNEHLDIGAELGSVTGDGKTMVVFGTHAGDFNTIEYMQKIRASLPELHSKGGIDRILVVVNGEMDQCKLLTSLVDLPTSTDALAIEVLSDPTGEAGRKFGVSRGFRPDDDSLPPFFETILFRHRNRAALDDAASGPAGILW